MFSSVYKIRLTEYLEISKISNIQFWVSAHYPYGFHTYTNWIIDLVPERNTIIYGDLKMKFNEHPAFYFNGKTRIISHYKFGTVYTFFLLARKEQAKDIGRVFTSRKGNRLLGWWNIYDRVLWIDQKHIQNNHPADDKIHLWILKSDKENTKEFYDGNEKIYSGKNDNNEEWEEVVLGKPTMYPEESLNGCYVYECICFNVALSELEIFKIRDVLNKYYQF